MAADTQTEREEPDDCIFVVEDESLVAMGLKNMLIRLGHATVHVFSSAENALAQLAALRPSLILMDIKLGKGMDGLAAAREVMEHHSCPVVITTAYAEEQYLAEAMQSHVFGYLVKPITAQQLASTMAVAHSRFDQFRSLRSANASLREALETRKLVERAKGILMQKKGLTELQAYELMRTQSQRRSTAMGDVAQNVIDAADLL